MEAANKKRRRRSMRNLNRLSTSVLAPPGALLDSTSCEEKAACYGSAWLEEGEDTNMDNLVKSFSQLACAEARGSPQYAQHSQESLDTSKDCSGKTWDGPGSTGGAQTCNYSLSFRDSHVEGTAPKSHSASVGNGERCEDLSQQANLPSFVSDVDVDEWLCDKYRPEEINHDRVTFEEKSKGSSFTKSTTVETVGRAVFDGNYHRKGFDSLERENSRLFPEAIEKARCRDVVISSPGLSSAADKSELCSLTSGNNSSELRSPSRNSWNDDGINLDNNLTAEREEVGVTLGDSGGDEALNEAFMSNLYLSDTDSSLDTSKNLNSTFTIMPEADNRDASVVDDGVGARPHVPKSIGPDDSFSPSYPPHPSNQSRQENTSPIRSLSETVLGSSPASIIQQLTSKLRCLQAMNVGSSGHNFVAVGKPGQENQPGCLELRSIDTMDELSAKKSDGMSAEKSDGMSTEKSDGMSTKKSDGMSAKKSDGMSTKKSDGMSAEKSDGMSTKKSDGMSTKKSDGMSAKKSYGMSTEKYDGMSTKKSDGMSTKKSDGMSAKKSDGMSTKKSDGMSTKKSDRMSAKKSDGMSTKKSDGMSAKKSDGMSTKKSDGMSAEKSDGMSAEKSDGMGAKKSDGMSAKKYDGMSAKKSDGMSTKKSDGLSTEKSDGMSIKKSDGMSTEKSEGMRKKISVVISSDESDTMSMLHSNVTKDSSCELVNAGQTASMVCHSALNSGQQNTGYGRLNCATDRAGLGEEGICDSVLDSQLQLYIYPQNTPQSLDCPEVVHEVDIPLGSLIPTDSSTVIPQEPSLTCSSNRPKHAEGGRGKTHEKKKEKETAHEPKAAWSDESVTICSALSPGKVIETSRRTSLKIPDMKGSSNTCSATSRPKKAKRRSMPTMKVSKACDFKNGGVSIEGKTNEESINSIQPNETLKLIISRRRDSGKYEVFPVDSKVSNGQQVDLSAGSVQGLDVCENRRDTNTACAALAAGEPVIPSTRNPLASTQDELTTEEVTCEGCSGSEVGQKYTEEGDRNSVACTHQEGPEDIQRKISERKARRRSSRYFHPQEMDNFRQALAEEGDIVSCKSADNTEASESIPFPRPSAVCQSLDFEQNIQNNESNAAASRGDVNMKQKRGRQETKASSENVGSMNKSNTEEAEVKQRKKKRKSQKFILSTSDRENIEPAESESNGSGPRSKETAMEVCESASGIECAGEDGDEQTLCGSGDGVESAVVVRKKPVRRNRKSWDLYKGQAKENDEAGHRRLRARKHVDYSADSFSDEEKPENLTDPVEVSELPGCVSHCLSSNEDCIPEDLENFYRNKNYVPPEPRVWETIKEHPTDPKQPFNKQRFRRFLPFEDRVPMAKLKRREKKAQTVFSKQALTWTPITDEMCERKLMDLYLCLESPSPLKTVYF